MSGKRIRHDESEANAVEKILAEFQRDEIENNSRLARAGGSQFVRGETLNKEHYDGEYTGDLLDKTYVFKICKVATEEPILDKADDLVSPAVVKQNVIKKKSALEMIKEEVMRREKEQYQTNVTSINNETGVATSIVSESNIHTKEKMVSNIFIGNLSPEVTECVLCIVFGRFGPLASVKVMWPRKPEEIALLRNTGFVSYMNREDSDAALNELHKGDLYGYEIKLNATRDIVSPETPFYSQPSNINSATDLPTNMPFNAIPMITKSGFYTKMSTNLEMEMMCHPIISETGNIDSVLGGRNNKRYTPRSLAILKSEVRVVVPHEKEANTRKLIHNVIKYVLLHGMAFEYALMQRESANLAYSFLFNTNCPFHHYYRWKLYSLLQGDTVASWTNTKFRMYNDGEIWVPPELELPPETTRLSEESMPVDNIAEFINLLKELKPNNNDVAEAMYFCITNKAHLLVLAPAITSQLKQMHSMLSNKVALIYLINDLLVNSIIPGAHMYRHAFEDELDGILLSLHEVMSKLVGRIKHEYFKARIISCLLFWESKMIFPPEKIRYLRNLFINGSSELEISHSENILIKPVAAVESIPKEPLMADIQITIEEAGFTNSGWTQE